jgi:hypothetical protein
MIDARGVAPERTGTDGYEGRVPQGAYDITTDNLSRELYIEALRAQIRCDNPLILVCDECEHRHEACDCPASVKRSVPLRPARSQR